MYPKVNVEKEDMELKATLVDGNTISLNT